jgi:NADPH-dependent glutamate synthase beta subunit-like oxidoreductase
VDYTVDRLRSRFDAVLLAGGAAAPHELPVADRDLRGVHLIMEYLTWANRVQQGEVAASPITAGGHDVVIILAFLGDARHRLRAVQVVDGSRDQARRFHPRPGAVEQLPAQLALGFTGGEPSRLLADLDITVDDRGTVARDEDFMSSVDGVFVAGDMGRGPSLDRVGHRRGPLRRRQRAHLPTSPDATCSATRSAPATSRSSDRWGRSRWRASRHDHPVTIIPS